MFLSYYSRETDIYGQRQLIQANAKLKLKTSLRREGPLRPMIIQLLPCSRVPRKPLLARHGVTTTSAQRFLVGDGGTSCSCAASGQES